MASTGVWFDIPATDISRAEKFYSAVLNVTLERIPGMPISIFPHKDAETGGCIVEGGGMTPGSSGVMVYLNAQGRLDDAIAQVVPNGGKIVQPKHPIGPHGFRAIVLDSEGNQVGLHSM